jgi:hypothetical protein
MIPTRVALIQSWVGTIESRGRNGPVLGLGGSVSGGNGSVSDGNGWLRLGFALKEVGGVGDVEDGEVEAGARIALLSDLHLFGNVFGAGARKVFYHTNADVGSEDDGEEAEFVHVEDEHAVLLSLLVNAVETGFVDKVGNGLVGHECAGGQRGDGGEVELPGVAVAADEEPALVYYEGCGSVRLFQ